MFSDNFFPLVNHKDEVNKMLNDPETTFSDMLDSDHVLSEFKSGSKDLLD